MILLSLHNYIRYVLIYVCSFWFICCTDLSDYDRERVADAIADSLFSVTETQNVQMALIQDGRRTVTVTAPYAATYTRAGQSETELKDSVNVTILDSEGEIHTTVVSETARYFAHVAEFHFKYNVVVLTNDGRRLFTDYLEWSYRNRSVYTPDFVTIVTPTDSITGFGLDGSDDLETYTLTEVTGEFELERNRNSQ
ncbi:MAG: LPS export ABC transporter periplasmic protein LptC [Balneolales bacterium]